MKILGLDLGKFKSVGCLLDSETNASQFSTVPASVAGSEKIYIRRGGSWLYPALECRSGTRVGDSSTVRFVNSGFRLVLPIPVK